MRKFFPFLFGLIVCCGFAAQAQVTITFKVDLTTYLSNGGTITPEGVHMAGNFTLSGGNLPDWTPLSGPMTNEGNNVWSRILIFNGNATDSLEWKYLRGNAWTSGDEGANWNPPDNTCAKPGSNNNRKLLLPTSGNWVVTSEWARCATITEVTNSVPTVLTGDISAVTQTSATVSGTVTNDGGSSISERGICYATTQNPTLVNNFVASGTGTGDFSSNLSGLTPGTVYFVRSYATNTTGTAYGVQNQFTTLGSSIQTFTVTYRVDITNYLAGGDTLAAGGIRIGGDFASRGTSLPNWTPSAAACALTNLGNNIWGITVTYPDTVVGRIQRYKFVNGDWGQNEGSGTSNIITGGCGVLDGSDINRTLTLANQNTTVTFCWDQCEATCSTLVALPTVVTGAVSAIAQTTASVAGNVTADGGDAVSTRGICFATTTNPTTANNIVASGTGTGAFNANLTGLTANTLYYVRAYATNSEGTAYGVQVQFTTLAQAIQTFTVTYRVDITNYLAGGDTLAAGGIRIGGDFASRGTSLPNWTPSAAACALTNLGNNIWGITVTYPDTVVGRIQRYKFVNGDWGQNEGSGTSNIITGGCGVLDGSDINRTLTLANQNTTVTFCWDQCEATCSTQVALPTVTTTAALAITTTTATLGGNVTADGGSAVTARGVCWSTSPNPVNTLPTTLTLGAGLGVFSGNASALTEATIYYVRSFATNGNGTAYGNQVLFRTAGGSGGSTIIFRVDIAEFLASGGIINSIVSIAGNFDSRGGNLPDWTPSSGPMTESSPNVWERTVQFDGSATDSLYWKYVQGADWSDGDEGYEWEAPFDASCIVESNYNNRKILIPASGRWLYFSQWARCGVLSPSTLIPVKEGPIAYSLFPNPAQDKVNLVLPDAENPTLKIVGMDGKIINNDIVSEQAGHFTIATTQLKPGKYMVLIVDKGKLQKAGFSVQR